jgi:hypothetical protein
VSVEARSLHVVVWSDHSDADEEVAEAIARVLTRYAVDFKSGLEVTFPQDGINVTYVAKPAINLASAVRAARMPPGALRLDGSAAARATWRGSFKVTRHTDESIRLPSLTRKNSLNLTRRDILPTLTAAFTTITFDDSGLQWLEISTWLPTSKDLPSSLVQLRTTVWTGVTRDTRPISEIWLLPTRE